MNSAEKKAPRRKPSALPAPRLPDPPSRSHRGWSVAGLAVVFGGGVTALGLGLLGAAIGLYVHDVRFAVEAGGIAVAAGLALGPTVRWLVQH